LARAEIERLTIDEQGSTDASGVILREVTAGPKVLPPPIFRYQRTASRVTSPG
jgi:hypothetical protein